MQARPRPLRANTSPDGSRTLRRSRALRVALVLMMVSGALVWSSPDSGAAVDPCAPATFHAIACENTLPGSPQSEWDVSGEGSPSIQGFATDISVDQGGRVDFKVDTSSTDYRLDIYRLGWYGGDGARRVDTIQPSAALPQNQPACLNDPATGLIDCGNWSVSASWVVPSTAVSGVYIARLVREDGTNDASQRSLTSCSIGTSVQASSPTGRQDTTADSRSTHWRNASASLAADRDNAMVGRASIKNRARFSMGVIRILRRFPGRPPRRPVR